jgi:peptide/nickel transport system permease protein
VNPHRIDVLDRADDDDIVGAIAERNYPVIQATILVVTSGFVLVNFLVDFLYMVIDPRVRA